MELPIVVSVDELNVGGFVDQVDLTVDVGPAGRRGSITYSGGGLPPETPNSTVTDIYGMVEQFEPGDLYIQTGSGTPYYAYLWIYQAQPGGNVWTAICPLQPTLYFNELTFSFTAGVSAEKQISLSEIFGTPTTSVPSSEIMINVQAVENSSSVYAFSTKSVVVDNGAGVLKVILNARQLDGTITNPTANIVVHFSVGVKSV